MLATVKRCITVISSVVVTLAACAHSRPPLEYGPRPVRELEQWRVQTGDEAIGRLVLLEIEDPRGDVRFYRAENAAGQWLGYIDTTGRVYQRVPFAMVEVFRGIHTMDKGLALLFEQSGDFEIVHLDRDGRPIAADARRPPALEAGR